MTLSALLLWVGFGSTGSAMAATDCAAASNPIVCENALPGTPPSVWQVQGIGDTSIQGYATAMSVDVGHTIDFKVDTPSSSYVINIYRLGWYGGDGARLIASNIHPSATLPQSQPACLTDAHTGLTDCGNWGVSASWAVPANAVSGVYIAELVRTDSQDPGGMSQIPFVVRNDASHSAILMPTNDATWQAYNAYGGNSLYSCTVHCPAGNPEGYKAAYAVSYNRPWDGSLTTDAGQSYLWYSQYQMIQWLERQGYNVSYTSDVQLGSASPHLLQHRLILFAGHDEYWSGGERANVTAARDAGVNLAMFTASEIFWKTRWGASIDSSKSPDRTLISYKETHFNGPVDPADPPTWTGAWADPRFSPPGDGGNPSNSLSGQLLEVNSGTADIAVPYEYHALPVWQHTAVANLKPGQSITLGAGDGTLGYEWDVAPDNGFRPAGEFNLSSTTVSGVQAFTDYGTFTSPATETHHLTLYRTASGALVFGAGTVQWSWGLANVNAWGEWNTEPSGNPPDPNMEQFTVNLLSLMRVQPGSLKAGLVTGPAPTSAPAPRANVVSPRGGTAVSDGSRVTVSGSASGGTVAGVEVSTDGGRSWHPATLTGPAGASVNWYYNWIAHGYPRTTIQARAVDAYGQLGARSAGVSVAVHCPCSLWGTNVTPASVWPGQIDSGDSVSAELGMRFTTSIPSKLTGIRFYKSAANTGTHVGSVWSDTGRLLAQGTFTGESAVGWQQLRFNSPVLLAAHQTYVVGYLDPHGHYSATVGWFYRPPAPTPLGGATTSSGPWSAVINSQGRTNGLFTYTSTPAFPTRTYRATNYWVDPILEPAPTTTAVPVVRTHTHHPGLRGRSRTVGNRRVHLTPKVFGTVRVRHGRLCVPPGKLITFRLTTQRLPHGQPAGLQHEELLLGHRRRAARHHGRIVVRFRHLRRGTHTVTARLRFTERRTLHVFRHHHRVTVHRTLHPRRTMRITFHIC